MERVFQLLALLYDQRDIMGAWLRFTGGDPSRRADALEFLENLLVPRHKLLLAGVRSRPEPVAGQRARALRGLIEHENLWLRCCAVRAVGPELLPRLRDKLVRLADGAPPR